MTTPVASGYSVSNVDLSSLDIETFLLSIQAKRIDELEEQLKLQMSEVQKRNASLEKLNWAHSKLVALQQNFPANSDPGKRLNDANYVVTTEEQKTAEADFNRFLDQEFGRNTPGIFETSDGAHTYNSNGQRSREFGYYLNGARTYGDLTKAVSKLKARIDALGSSQQMDMLRLQALTGKRNEAYEVCSNYTKKMQDGRNSILSNMR